MSSPERELLTEILEELRLHRALFENLHPRTRPYSIQQSEWSAKPFVHVRPITSAGPGECFFSDKATVMVSERDFSLVKQVVDAAAQYTAAVEFDRIRGMPEGPRVTTVTRHGALWMRLIDSIKRFQEGK